MKQSSRTMPGKDRDEKSGEYTTTYTTDDFLDAIKEEGGMAGTSDIAERVGCSRRNAHTRLEKLEEQGEVSSRMVGNSLVWTVSDD
jgi:DNA-binding MarR family transcriptional regulator